MSETRDILIASREAMAPLVQRLNGVLDLSPPLTARTLRGEGRYASISWEIAEGVLHEAPITLLGTDGFDLDLLWRIDEDSWRRFGWNLSIDVRWRLPETDEACSRRMDDLALEVMAQVGDALSVPCVALSDLQTPLGFYPS